MANPAALRPTDHAWAALAVEQLAAIGVALRDLPGGESAALDHIGSTAVPGLAAKPFIDLQVRILPLPSEAELVARLGPLGYHRERGARPDSPGVDRDLPRGPEIVPPRVWEKRLFVAPTVPAILHVRRADSPWARSTVQFRDWLRAHPRERERYAAIKQELAEQNRGKGDYDDYTRAKTAFFDEIEAELLAWAGRHRPETP